MIKIIIGVLLGILIIEALASYPIIYKSKGYNFKTPNPSPVTNAIAVTLDVNNALYLWIEPEGQEAIEVATLENFCEPAEAE